MESGNYKEKELVRCLRKGDIDAFNQLYEKYNLKLFYFIRGYVGVKEDIEELIQEVFMTIWETRIRLKENLSFNAYIFTITYNAILKYYRHKGRRLKHTQRYLLDTDMFSNTLMENIESKYLREQIEKIISTLPAKRQMIFRLSREKGLSNKEISEKLSLSIRTVESQIYQALKFIKKQIIRENLLVLLVFLLLR